MCECERSLFTWFTTRCSVGLLYESIGMPTDKSIFRHILGPQKEACLFGCSVFLFCWCLINEFRSVAEMRATHIFLLFRSMRACVCVFVVIGG